MKGNEQVLNWSGYNHLQHIKQKINWQAGYVHEGCWANSEITLENGMKQNSPRENQTNSQSHKFNECNKRSVSID